MWRAEAGRAAIERSRHFDLVVEPGELAASLDVGATAGRRDETVQVPPVLLLDAEELLDRDAARAELGLDPGRTAVLVQLGSRNNFDYAAIDQAILDELGGRPDVELVHVDWLIGEAEPELPPRVRRLRTFPVTRYLRAFDLAVSAVGYNSFHELLAFGVPSIFVPNENPIMDAQELRAAWAERHGLALAVGRRDPVPHGTGATLPARSGDPGRDQRPMRRAAAYGRGGAGGAAHRPAQRGRAGLSGLRLRPGRPLAGPRGSPRPASGRR